MSHSKGAKLRAGVTLQAGTWVGVQTGSWTRLQVGGVAVAAQAWGVQSGPQVPSGHPPVLRPQTQMQQIMAHCFLAVKSKLECKLGYFDLIGCDFLIDENFKVLLWCAGREDLVSRCKEAGTSVHTLTPQVCPGGGGRLSSNTTPSSAGDESKRLRSSGQPQRPDPQTLSASPWGIRGESGHRKEATSQGCLT